MTKIFEGKASDISTIVAVLKDGTRKTWSCFNGDYQVREEHKFINELDAQNPGVYDYFSIYWDDCN